MVDKAAERSEVQQGVRQLPYVSCSLSVCFSYGELRFGNQNEQGPERKRYIRINFAFGKRYLRKNQSRRRVGLELQKVHRRCNAGYKQLHR